MRIWVHLNICWPFSILGSSSNLTVLVWLCALLPRSLGTIRRVLTLLRHSLVNNWFSLRRRPSHKMFTWARPVHLFQAVFSLLWYALPSQLWIHIFFTHSIGGHWSFHAWGWCYSFSGHRCFTISDTSHRAHPWLYLIFSGCSPPLAFVHHSSHLISLLFIIFFYPSLWMHYTAFLVARPAYVF